MKVPERGGCGQAPAVTWASPSERRCCWGQSPRGPAPRPHSRSCGGAERACGGPRWVLDQGSEAARSQELRLPLLRVTSLQAAVAGDPGARAAAGSQARAPPRGPPQRRPHGVAAPPRAPDGEEEPHGSRSSLGRDAPPFACSWKLVTESRLPSGRGTRPHLWEEAWQRLVDTRSHFSCCSHACGGQWQKWGDQGSGGGGRLRQERPRGQGGVGGRGRTAPFRCFSRLSDRPGPARRQRCSAGSLGGRRAHPRSPVRRL